MKYCCEASRRIAAGFRLVAGTEFGPDLVGRTDFYRHPSEGQVISPWDEDFDTRIWHFVDWLARGGLMGQCALVGEAHGTLSLVVKYSAIRAPVIAPGTEIRIAAKIEGSAEGKATRRSTSHDEPP